MSDIIVIGSMAIPGWTDKREPEVPPVTPLLTE